MRELNIVIKRGLTDNASRQVVINNELVKFEDKNILNNTFTAFLKDEIAEYKFGIYWLRLDLTFGRQYRIYIRNINGKVLKINFKTYFGRRVNEYHKKYNDILDALWKHHFGPITDTYLRKFQNEEEFMITNVHFTKDGVDLKGKNMFIPWSDVRTSDYHSYFSIYSIKKPDRINKGYSYMEDWNTSVLCSVLRTILKFKNIENHN